MKSMVFGLAVAAGLSAFAAQNNTILNYTVSASSVYADGTPVMDGERYALVFIPAGTAGEFKLAANGRELDAANGSVIKVKSVRKYKGESRCYFNFQLTPEEVKAYDNGSLAVYRLDTRVFGANGAVTLAALDDNGRPTAVNAATLVPDAQVAVDKDIARNAQLANGAKVDGSSKDQTAVPGGADAPGAPVITGVKVANGKVTVSVASTVPYIQYNLTRLDGSTAGGEKNVAEQAKNGVVGGEIELISEGDGAVGLFKVERNTK